MKRLLPAIVASVFACSHVQAQEPNRDPNIDSLVRRLSLDEKIGQMVQIDLLALAVPNSSPIQLDEAKLREALVTYKIGSLLNNGVNHALTVEEWHRILNHFQDMIRAETPHKIPVLYGIDTIHGATYVLGSTLFPQSIAMAATRDPELLRRCAEISATETRAAGIRWNFAPVLDVARQPLWSRTPETFGEDPYLASVLGVAAVSGFQESHAVLRVGDLVEIRFESSGETKKYEQRIRPDGMTTLPFVGGDISVAGKTERQLEITLEEKIKSYRSLIIRVKHFPASSEITVAACMKHFLGYSFPFSGKDRTPAYIPNSYLREYFLPPFRDAIKAGAKTIMIDSGEINGVPVHADKYLLTDLLRGELGFRGVVDSDWQDIIRLHTVHQVAATPKDAVLMAVNAGIDMSMVPLDYSFADLLKQLVKERKISERRINESVRRILELKKDVGLFRNPYVEPEATNNFGRPEYAQAALQAAEEAMTLLKNENSTLPLAKSAKVLVVGPAARSVSALHGCWSYTWQGNDERWYPKSTLTIVDAIREKIGAENVLYHQGVDFTGKSVDSDAAVANAAKADCVVLCLGEDAYAETPGDINDLDLPIGQQELAKQLYATGKPVVLVLVEGRTRIIRDIEPGAKGILMAYWPGSQGARAIANVLFGDTNPSGKLPFTYQRYPNNLITYDRKRSDRSDEIDPPSGHKSIEYTPQWEFGFGLGYTTFEVANLKLSSSMLKGSRDRMTVSVDVSNTGKREGVETVELYTHDLYASITPPLKRLRAFHRVALAPGERKTVAFELRAADLAFANADGNLVTEPGDFEAIVGGLKAGFKYER